MKPEGRMAQWAFLLCREKREPGGPQHSLEFHQTGKAQSGEEKQTQKRPAAFQKYRWGFMSNMEHG